MIISVAEARGLLGPHIPTLKKCVDAGLYDFNVEHGSNRHYLSPHSRAMIIRDLIIFHVRKAFDGKEGVSIIEKGRLFLLNIGGKILLRFKKMNERMLASNVPTKQALDFSRQQLSFKGFLTPITNMNVGYIPNDVWTYPEKVIIACPNDMSSNHWHMDITEEEQMKVAPVHPIFEHTESDNKRRIRAKGHVQTKKTVTGSEK